MESVLFHVPVWAPPNLALVAAGLDQVGVPNKRFWGDVSNPETRARLRAFFVAASALHRLRGSKYGCLGGRSLGIYTATFDAAQWQRAFGVDAEHVDQLEVVRRSEAVPEKQVLSLLEWMAREGLRAEFNGGALLHAWPSAVRTIPSDEALVFGLPGTGGRRAGAES